MANAREPLGIRGKGIDLKLTADRETFEGLLDGDINATSAFMTGKLTVDGDMSVAMNLGALLS